MAIKFVGTLDITDIPMPELKIYLCCVKERIYKTIQEELKIGVKSMDNSKIIEIYIMTCLYDEEGDGEEISLRALHLKDDIFADAMNISKIIKKYYEHPDISFQVGMKPHYLYSISIINNNRKNAIKGLEQYKAEAMDKILDLEEMCNDKNGINFQTIQISKKKEMNGGKRIEHFTPENNENTYIEMCNGLKKNIKSFEKEIELYDILGIWNIKNILDLQEDYNKFKKKNLYQEFKNLI